MARNTDEHKPTLPRVSMGLGNILAQSGVVVAAFGKPMGFVIMMSAVLGSAAVGVSMAFIVVRSLIRMLASV